MLDVFINENLTRLSAELCQSGHWSLDDGWFRSHEKITLQVKGPSSGSCMLRICNKSDLISGRIFDNNHSFLQQWNFYFLMNFVTHTTMVGFICNFRLL